MGVFPIRLRRLDESASITVFEKGPYNSFANCGLPYFIGGVIPTVVFGWALDCRRITCSFQVRSSSESSSM